MMAHKHLHELLQEDQEPFLLKNYISERKTQLQIVPKSSVLLPKKRTPISPSAISKRSLYGQACFFSFRNSPDPRKSPAKSSNAVSLHVPARTAALLLESALRIQKQPSNRTPKTQISNLGSGLLGSFFRRLSGKNHNRKRQICNAESKGKKSSENVAVDMGFSWSCYDDDENRGGKNGSKMKKKVVRVEDGSPIQMGFFSCSCSTSRRASSIWSESNEEKWLDLESCSSDSSRRSYDFDEGIREDNEDFEFCEKGFCSTSTPLRSPFRFALETNCSSGERTPAFSSLAASPSRHKIQEREDCEVVLQESMVEVEEEKEQFSPVSVLDPPFEDDSDCNEEEASYDLECSYAIIERAKRQLLHKLRRFEKLAELDPIELEKRMLEEEDDENMNSEDLVEEGEEEFDEAESLSSYVENNANYCVGEVIDKLGFQFSAVPAHMERLVSDLIAEEKREEDGESEVRRVCKKLDSWKEEKSNTIHMMVALAFRGESDHGWKRIDKNQVIESAMEIEQSIFGLLVEELSKELVEISGERS